MGHGYLHDYYVYSSQKKSVELTSQPYYATQQFHFLLWNRKILRLGNFSRLIYYNFDAVKCDKIKFINLYKSDRIIMFFYEILKLLLKYCIFTINFKLSCTYLLLLLSSIICVRVMLDQLKKNYG